MNYKKWYSFLKEAKEEQKLTDDTSSEKLEAPKPEEEQKEPSLVGFDSIMVDDLTIFDIMIKVQIRKTSAVLLTQIKNKIRAIPSVTTVTTTDLADSSQSYDLQEIKIKFALAKGANLDDYIKNTLVPELRQIKGMTVLHYYALEKL